MNALIGIWIYTSLIYGGQPMPRPNPELHIYYTFNSSFENEILYYRENERGQCRRRAEYRVEDNKILQKITWVDPENAESCSQDSDMQMGNTSEVKFEIKDSKLLLHLPLGDDELIYVWDKVPEISSDN